MPRLGLGMGRSRRLAGGGGGGAPPPTTTADFDFTGIAVGSATAPTGLSFSRSSSASVLTAATGTGQIVTSGLGVDVPGCGVGNSTISGLICEESRTNLDHQARQFGVSPWDSGSASTLTANDATGVDGTATIADRVVNATGRGPATAGAIATVVSSVYTASCYIRHSSSSALYQSRLALLSVAAGTCTTTWQRIAMTGTATATQTQHVVGDCSDRTANGGIGLGARDALYDLHQYELGKFPTSPILTSGSQTTRTGTRWWIATPSAVMSSGRVGMYFECRPLGAFSEYTADIYLWYYDVNNHARITFSTGQTTIVVAGVSYTTAGTAWTWTRGQKVEGFVAAGGGTYNSRVKYKVGAGSWVDQGTSGAAAAALPTTALDILCKGTANQLSSSMQRWTFYTADNEPA